MKMSRIEGSTRVVLAFNEAFNRHDVAAMMRLVSDDCRVEPAASPPDEGIYSGREAVTRFWEGFFRDSPAARREIEEIFGLGLRCVMRWHASWVDGAGHERHARGVDLFQIRNGLICEQLSYVRG